MKLEVSDKTSSSTAKVRIKKGYYPAQLTKIEEFKDKDGNLKDGKYGSQLILSFDVYDNSDKVPSKRALFENKPVTIPKFVYFQYKDQKTNQLRTAFTPESAITKLFEALGWNFTPGTIDLDQFIGKWAELNIDDYDVKDAQGNVTGKASGIQKVNKYDGEVPSPSATQPDKDKVKRVAELRKQINDARELYEGGQLTKVGYDNVVEQNEVEIKKLQGN